MSALATATPHDVALAKTMVSVILTDLREELNAAGNIDSLERRSREMISDSVTLEQQACGLMECEDDYGHPVYNFNEQDNTVIERMIEEVCEEFRLSLRNAMRECMTKFIS